MHIVTGMHRSGTSFLSQALYAMGADFGPTDRLFAKDYWNQNGYFESIDAVDTNNRMILGDRAKIEYWLKAPENGLNRLRNSIAARKWKYLYCPSTKGIAQRGSAYDANIRSVHSDYRGLYVKDPRFCLSLQAWASRGPIESLVFTFRSPGSVARSIKRREGLPLFIGHEQWLYHQRSFFSQMPDDIPLRLVDFDAFFDRSRQSQAFEGIIKHLGGSVTPSKIKALRDTLEPRLRNHALPPEDAPKRIRSAYDAIKEIHGKSSQESVLLKDHPNLRARILGK